MIIDMLKNTWSIFLGVIFLMLGNGLQGTLTGWRATFEGFSPTLVGFIMTGYSAGFLIGSFLTPLLVRNVGHIRVFAAVASAASASILIQIIWIDPTVWFATRLVTGICFAGAYVIVESWLNARSDDENRGQVFSIYMMVNFISMAGGQWFMLLADPARFELFLVASILLSISLVPVLISRIHAPEIEQHDKMGFRELFAHASTGTVSVVLSGVVQGSLFSMGAVYALNAGMSVKEIAIFMSAFILLGAFLQWPAGWISDRMDRRKLIAMIATASALMSLLLGVVEFSKYYFIGLFAVLGGLSVIIYSLAVSTTNDRLRPQQMVSAGATIVLLWGSGAIMGPPLAGMMMDALGQNGFLVHLGVMHLANVLLIIFFLWVKPPVTTADQTPFYAVAPRATGLAMETLAHDAEELDDLPEEAVKDSAT